MMQYDNRCHVPKESYIGAPVKHVIHTCHVCGHEPCTCGGGKACSCGGKGCNKCAPKGICTAVVDDANNTVYLYGNIMHENYHVPGNQCIAWTGVTSAGFKASGRRHEDEFFEGEQDENTVRLKYDPINDGGIMVFLNGVKQREGNEYDYIINGNSIHFNFYELLETDTVEVMYDYGAE